MDFLFCWQPANVWQESQTPAWWGARLGGGDARRGTRPPPSSPRAPSAVQSQGRARSPGWAGGAATPSTRQRLSVAPSPAPGTLVGRHRVWERPPRRGGRGGSLSATSWRLPPTPRPQGVCMSPGKETTEQGPRTLRPVRTHTAGPGKRDRLVTDSAHLGRGQGGPPPPRPPRPLTCVDPQVDLQVVGRAEALPAVGTVLHGRAQAPVPGQHGLLDARGPPRLLAHVCSGEETFAHHFGTCQELFTPKLPPPHKAKHVTATPVYSIL